MEAEAAADRVLASTRYQRGDGPDKLRVVSFRLKEFITNLYISVFPPQKNRKKKTVVQTLFGFFFCP